MKNFYRMGYDAFWAGDSCPEDATPEQAAEWKRGWDYAVHRAMLEEFRT